MTKLREAAQAALDALEQIQGGCTDHDDGTVEAITVWCPEVIADLRAALDAEPAQAVAWRDHVEQRMRTWRQCRMNRSGDQLALDDFMDSESLEDLIDFVCDEWAGPQPTADVPAQPVAWIDTEDLADLRARNIMVAEVCHGRGKDWETPLYASPQPPADVPRLTIDEIEDLRFDAFGVERVGKDLVCAVEAEVRRRMR